MTEAEWMACADPHPMLEFLRGKASDRKLRLFAVACCRGIWEQIEDVRGRLALEVAERYADNMAHLEELIAAHSAHDRTFGKYPHDGIYYAIEAATEHPAGFDPYYVLASSHPSLIGKERQQQSSVLRDLFGDLFCPISADPSWITSTVFSLASRMYDSRDFSPMPILADALQDAGCDNNDILNHCRSTGVHVRGCWVVDLLIGKE
jgi:hypothetical protein